jgi:nucleotide-binding universal stress UspA family protein
MRPIALHSILVATDLSEASDDVVRGAAAIAELTGAELHIISVVEPKALPYPGSADSVLDMQRRIHEARTAVDAQVGRALPSSFQVTSRRVAYGGPYAMIQERVGEIDADLVVIGPHRPRPFGSRLLGKTADRLVRALDVPCLVLRGSLPLPLERVLVATDLSPVSIGAIDVAVDWAVMLRRDEPVEAAHATRVRILHVAPWFLGGEVMPNERPTMGDLLHTEVVAAVERAGGELPVGVEDEVIWGDAPAEDILRHAYALNADLLVVGSHGTGALARALIGSVSSAVVRDADCPVLLVPPSAARPAIYAIEEAAAEPHNEYSPAIETW